MKGTFIAVIISLVLSSAFSLSNLRANNQSLEASSIASCVRFPYYTYFQDSELQQTIFYISTKQSTLQKSTLVNLANRSFKFFTPDQVVTLVQQFTSYCSQTEIQVCDGYTGILQSIQQYLPQMSMQQVLAILAVTRYPYTTGIVEILAPLICDQNTDTINQFINSFPNAAYFNQYYLKQAVLSPITLNGNFYALIYDTSDPMFTPITLPDGTTSNRWNSLLNFYNNNSGFQQNFDLSFTGPTSMNSNFYPYQGSGVGTSGIRVDPPIPTYRQLSTGELKLQEVFTALLQAPNDLLSDVFLLSSGIGPAKYNDVNQIVNLITSSNSQRSVSVRINVFAFLYGGDISESERATARSLLQQITTRSNGTYIEINP